MFKFGLDFGFRVPLLLRSPLFLLPGRGELARIGEAPAMERLGISLATARFRRRGPGDDDLLVVVAAAAAADAMDDPPDERRRFPARGDAEPTLLPPGPAELALLPTGEDWGAAKLARDVLIGTADIL
mmetsp:Transcript_44693/g.107814  ORF Transcript_44693/g.107814 Transcript_44693/m.107814 type:complete len:128 (+) Transcript_44693:545-928(+)